MAARSRRRRGGGEWGEGVPLPSRLGCLGERRKLPQRDPGGAPAQNGFWCILGLKEPMWRQQI